MDRHSRARAAFPHTNCDESRRSLPTGRPNFKRHGMNTSVAEVVALATEVAITDDELTVQLADGRRISVPLVWFPRLLNASPGQRSDFRLIGAGEGIHWPGVDEDLSVTGLLAGTRGQLNPAGYMPASATSTETSRASHRSEYRKRNDAVTWHWCANCSTYPVENYSVSRGNPTAGELCNECQTKQRAGTCAG